MTDPIVTQAGPMLNLAKIKYPSLPPPFPPEFYPFLGIIAVGWGTYETHFNRWLAAAVDATQDAIEPHWKILDYRRRREYARKLFNAHFWNMARPKAYLLQALNDSAVIHNKRNTILHGKLACGVYRSKPTQLIAEARLNRRTVIMRFTADDLETLGYELMHLAGRLNLTFLIPTPGLSSRDMRALEALVSRIPPTPSILPTLPAQPRPSRA